MIGIRLCANILLLYFENLNSKVSSLNPPLRPLDMRIKICVSPYVEMLGLNPSVLPPLDITMYGVNDLFTM